MLFKNFIMSSIAFCLPIISTCIYASDKKATYPKDFQGLLKTWD